MKVTLIDVALAVALGGSIMFVGLALMWAALH